MSYTLTPRMLTTLRARLTRAKKQGPEAIKRACVDAYNLFERHGYPDAWAIWQAAFDDANGWNGKDVNPFHGSRY